MGKNNFLWLSILGVFIIIFNIEILFAGNQCNDNHNDCSTDFTNGCDVRSTMAIPPGTYNFPDGIDICASGIILDCAGATLNDPESQSGPAAIGFSTGILEFQDVTIKNCKINNYTVGIAIANFDSSTVEDNKITNSLLGIGTGASSQHNVISNNDIINTTVGGTGISVAANNTVTYNLLEGGANAVGIESTNSNITENTVRFTFQGISAGDKDFVSNNIITNNLLGMRLQGSGKSLIINNTISFNSDGILVVNIRNSTIVRNTIDQNGIGIILESFAVQDDFNEILNNRIIENNNTGIQSLEYIENYKIENNLIKDNKGHGIDFFGERNEIINNSIFNNNKSGILLNWNTHNNTISDNTINNSELDGILVKGSTFNKFSGNKIHNSKENGIFVTVFNFFGTLKFPLNNDIISNNVSENMYGIFLNFTNNTNIIGNIISNNTYDGILLKESSSNIFINNSVVFNHTYGIELFSSKNNTFFRNNISNNFFGGMQIIDSNSTDISNNLIIRNSLPQFSNDAGIGIKRSDNLTIDNNIISQNNLGIVIGILTRGTKNSVIRNNSIISNSIGFTQSEGIHIEGSQDVEISNNVIFNHSEKGIEIGPTFDAGPALRLNITKNKIINSSIGINTQGQSAVIHSSQIVENIVCLNGLDFNLDQLPFVPPPVVNTTAKSNVCDSAIGWNDTDQTGCTFICGIQGNATDGHGHRLIRVEVDVSFDDKVFSNASDGNGTFKVHVNDSEFFLNSSKDIFLNLTLNDSEGYISVFDWTADPINPSNWQTNSFHIETVNDLLHNLNASDTSDISNHNAGALANLDDLAFIYFHTKEAADFAKHILRLKLDYSLPVEIKAYSSATPRVFYCPNGVFGCSPQSFINIHTSSSQFNNGNTPDNREWHEFGHHIMADSLIGGENIWPFTMPDNYHGGYLANPDSVAGWAEGFASFISIMIKVHGGNDDGSHSNPACYRALGNNCILHYESQYDLRRPVNIPGISAAGRLATSEEASVTSLLWDLFDGINATDNDHVQLTLQQIWAVLNQTTAAGTGGIRLDMKDVYDAFVNSGIPVLAADTDQTDNTTNNLDEIFVAHGWYDDLDGDLLFDPPTETVGLSGSNGPPPTGDPPPGRRNVPPINGSFISVTALDGFTNQPIGVGDFSYDIVYDSPFDIYDISSTIVMLDEIAPLIYFGFYVEDPPAIAHIIAKKEGYQNSDPLIMNSSFYWNNLNDSNSFFLAHTFILTPLNQTNTTLVPSIEFIPPTPENGTTQSNTDIPVSIESSDDTDHYTFLDFDEDVLLWMRFDDVDNDGNPTDLSTYQNDGSLINGATINSGVYGNAVHFDGIDDMVNIPHEDDQILVSKGSWSFWLKLNSYNDADTFVSKRDRWNINNAWVMGNRFDQPVCPNQSMFEFSNDGVTNRKFCYNETFIPLNTWSHLAYVFDTGDVERNVRFYVNGIEIIPEVEDNQNTPLFPGDSEILIGATNNATAGFLNGSVDDLLIFNRALNQNEVLSLYSATKNQYSNNFTELEPATYEFVGFAVDLDASRNQTEKRLVTILEETCPEDLDGNNIVGTSDLIILLGAWGQNPGHPADFDDNGFVDTSDLIILLGAWGTCGALPAGPIPPEANRILRNFEGKGYNYQEILKLTN